jgi:hypothetical protein
LPGTRAALWRLQTPSLASQHAAFQDAGLDPPALVARAGKTELRYRLRRIDALNAMPMSRSPLPMARSKPGRGRFGNYAPPELETLALAEAERNAKSNRMRAM